jgi:hypothetical protein
MTKKLLLFVVVLFVLACAGSSYGDLVMANNPGALPGTAQDLTGVNVTEITGTIPDTLDPLLGVNMFAIDVTDSQDFSAITIGSPFGITDTELFLFNSLGFGVMGNDDIDGGNTLSCLPSANSIFNPCPSAPPSGVGPMANGIYYLAITRSSNMPLSATGEIFTIFNSTDVVGPDTTMGGNDPITDWDGGAFTSADTDLTGYDIVLTGVSAPEPATWALLAIGLAFVLIRRKRLASS